MSLLSMLFGGGYPANEHIKVLTSDEYKTQISKKKIQLIDVRTAREFSSSHIKGAKNIDFYSGQFATEFNKLNKNKPVFIYCRTGSRSRHASNKLAKMGFTEIYDLKGGFVRWN